jgi:putative FmdB family regulatory protein
LDGIIAVQPPQLKITMPFYEYECQNCKFYSELLQKISDPPLEKCPSCGKKTMKKLISAPVFRLKGAGWYETDFKSDNENKRNLAGADKEEAKAAASSEESSGTKAGAKSDGKDDAKPAAAAETKTAAPAEAKSAGSSGSSGSSGSRSSSGRSAVAAKGGHKKAAGKPAPKPASRAASKPKAKAKAKGKAGKGRR